MNKNLRSIILVGVILFFALALSVSEISSTQSPENLSVQAIPGQTGPQVISQSPVAGQRLDLSPTIQITFDREMNQQKTSNAFSLLGPDNQPVSGESTWRDARTFEFTPKTRLEPASAYIGIFSTSSAGLDGTSPKENIELNFMTVEGLKVGQVFPLADAEDVDPTTTITIIFNHPVVPLTINEEQSNLPQPIELSPLTKGTGQWVNSSVYVFQPDKALTSGIRYTVRVGAGLKDTTGNSLEQSYLSQFTTRAPAVASFALKNGVQNPKLDNVRNVLLDQAFVITFLQPMNSESVDQETSVTNRGTGKSVSLGFNWNKDYTELTLQPNGHYQITSNYHLQITSAAQAQDGGTLKNGLSVDFSTVPYPSIVKVTPEPNSIATSYNSLLSIQFASPMQLSTLKGKVIITPAPKTDLQWYYNGYGYTYSTYGLEPGTSYSVRILPGMADIYGNTIDNEYSSAFKTADRDPYARMIVPWTPLVYRAKGSQDIWFEHMNLNSVTLSLYSISFDDFKMLLNGNGDNKGNVSMTGFVPQTPPVWVWNPDTNEPRNQTNRLDLKLQDQKGNPLPPGYYFIGVKGSPLKYKTNFYQAFAFIIATDNITFKATSSEGLAWVTDLENGAPQANIPVMFYDKNLNQVGTTTSTDLNGLVYLRGIDAPVYAQVEGTNHLAFVATTWGSGVWTGDLGIAENYYGNTNAPFIYLYTDRAIYRPGQDVFFKGLVRQNDDLHYRLLNDPQVYVTIEEAGQQVYAKYLSISQLGSIHDDFKLGDDAALGTYTISVSTSPTADAFGSLGFRVAEYHKPQFQVGISADKSNILNGEKVDFSLDATYYSGGNVGDAKVDWFTDATPYTFTPDPKYGQFSFTDWDQDQYYLAPGSAGQGGTLKQGSDTTDANGHLDLSQALSLGEDKTDQQVTLHANVTDVAGDVVSGQTSVIVHQSELYSGIRSLSYVGKAGEAQQVEAVALDWNSKPIPGQNLTIKFVERQWLSVQKQDKQGQLSWVTTVKEIPIDKQNVTTDSDGKATISFTPPEGGVYKAIVVITDANGNTWQSSAYTWVSSKKYVAWRQTNDRTFNLVSDKNKYSPGDTAELLIAQPFQGNVYALVTYERGHIYKQDVVLLTGNSTIYKLPITSDMAPMAYVSIVVVKGTDPSTHSTPDFKIGLTRINVDTSQQTLDVKVTTDKQTAGPNDNVTYTITTKDQTGNPVSADVSLAVVDKAVLALAPSNSDPILKSFYPNTGLGVQTALGLVSSADDFNAQYRQSLPEGGGAGGGGAGESLGIITVRQNFKDTAFFQAQVTTDSKGQAQVTVKLPENLTTWVADARAATVDGRVGQATDELVSTKPLFVELQTPSFFVAGDQARVGAVLHNNGAEPLLVNVSLEAQGVLLITPAAQTVNVPAKYQTYVTWDLKVDQDAQRVDLTAQAISGSFTDSSKPALGTLSGQGIPVYTYMVTEPVGTAGIISSANSITESILLPSSHNYTDANVSVQVSPSLTASMQDSLTYLKDYPYYCMEQTISSFMPNVVTTRALKLAGISNPSLQSNLDQQVNSALQKIYAKQLSDGGWNWWDGPNSDPQVSAYVVLGLVEAKDSGYPVAQDVLNNGTQYISQNLPNLYQNAATWQYNRFAFMLYVLARTNELQAGQTNFIYEHRTSLSLYGKAYLAQGMYLLDPKDTRINSLLSDLAAATVMSAAGAHWQEKGPADYWNWNTDTRTTAIVLNAFVQIDPKNPITTNAVRWLMAARQGKSWYSTQETSWALIALTNWLTTSKEYQTNYPYAVGLNGSSIARGVANKANLTQSIELKIQLKDLLKDTANYLVLTRGNGTGNLYYTAYLNANLAVASLKPLDQGMSLSRQYFTLTDSKHPVTLVQRGDLVKVRLTIVVPDDLHYIVINDPLPAGLQAIDASIATDMTVPSKYTTQDYAERGYGWWYFDHTELRDEKVVLSADYLPAGTYVYTYLARAGTAGTFNVIPSNASEFYFPDVGGRGAGSQFVVKP